MQMDIFSSNEEGTFVKEIKRYLEQTIVDKNPVAASDALVRGIHLLQTNPAIVKRCDYEVRAVVDSAVAVVQLHDPALLHQMPDVSSIGSPLVTSLVICLIGEVITQSGNTQRKDCPFYDYLKAFLHHEDEFIVLEAAKAITKLRGVTRQEFDKGIDKLLNSSNSNIKLAANEILYKIENGDGHFAYLCIQEKKTSRRPTPEYIKVFANNTRGEQRARYINSMVLKAIDFEIQSDSLYLAISYFDRYTSRKFMKGKQVVLLGMTCLLIASKDDTKPISVEDLMLSSDLRFTREEFSAMQTDVKTMLKEELHPPTVLTFFRLLIEIAKRSEPMNSKEILENTGHYISSLSLIDNYCLAFLPSIIGASATFLANFTINPYIHPWNSALRRYSGFSPKELRDCVLALQQIQNKERLEKFKALQNMHKDNPEAFKHSNEIKEEYFEENER